MKKILIIFLLITMNFTFGQSGSSGIGKFFKNSSVMIGMNESFYDKELNGFIGNNQEEGLSLNTTQGDYRKLNFTLLNEFDKGVLGGIKYISYGYELFSEVTEFDYYNSNYINYNIKNSLDLKFLKLFITRPLSTINGFYLGVEGGIFMNGTYKNRRSPTRTGYNDSFKYEFDREKWKDEFGLSEFDFGLLSQYYYSIKENLLLSAEGYYDLSKFDKNMEQESVIIPNIFHYVNLGVVYKFGKKVTK